MIMLWLKAFHIIAVVTWFAGLFYLPRLFVYHAMSNDEISNERFKIMERKLYRGIMTPSAIVAAFFGICLIFYVGPATYFSFGWFHAKIFLVILLIAYHIYCGRLVRVFAENRNARSDVWYRVFNELPVLVLVCVVILVVVKPF